MKTKKMNAFEKGVFFDKAALYDIAQALTDSDLDAMSMLHEIRKIMVRWAELNANVK